MRSKLLNAFLLAIGLVLDAAIIFFLVDPWLRLTLGLLLLMPIVWLASHLGVAELLGNLPTVKVRDRRFPALRRNVEALLDEVKRLNWLVVDLDRGFRDRGTVEAEVKVSEQQMEKLLVKIRKTAGQTAQGLDEEEDTPPGDAPSEHVGEAPVEGKTPL